RASSGLRRPRPPRRDGPGAPARERPRPAATARARGIPVPAPRPRGGASRCARARVDVRRLEARLVADVRGLRERDRRGALLLVVPSRLLGIGRAHAWTPVTDQSRVPPSACTI